MQLRELLDYANVINHEEFLNGHRFQRQGAVYSAVKPNLTDIRDDIYYTHYRAEEYALAEENAQLLRLSLLDEELPITQPLIYQPPWIVSFGGRLANVISLGRIKYYPALPELNEVALHDLDEGMQYEALNAIGRFGKDAQIYERGIVEHMVSLPCNWVQAQAAKVLGEIGTKLSLNVLKELYEYISGIMRVNERRWNMTGEDSYFREMSNVRMGVRRTLQSMIQIDEAIGKKVLEYALQDESMGVRHEAKIVKDLSKTKKR